MKEIKISFAINLALKRCDVHWAEEQLLKMREEVFLEVLRRVLEEVEAMAVEIHKRCERCGGWLLRNGHEDKQIRTLVGALRYRRIRLRCQGCGGEVYPLDAALEGKVEPIVDGLVEEALRDRLKSEKLFQLAEYVMNNAEWIRNIPEVKGYG